MSQKARVCSRIAAAPVGALSGRKVRVHDCLGISQTEGVGWNEKPAGPRWGNLGWLANHGRRRYFLGLKHSANTSAR